jgi:hypothetical protein
MKARRHEDIKASTCGILEVVHSGINMLSRGSKIMFEDAAILSKVHERD